MRIQDHHFEYREEKHSEETKMLTIKLKKKRNKISSLNKNMHAYYM